MESELDTDVTVSADGRGVVFTIGVRGTRVSCVVSRQALEFWFWLQPDADNARLLKAYRDGAHRIAAVATRKALRVGPSTSLISLGEEDFRN